MKLRVFNTKNEWAVIAVPPTILRMSRNQQAQYYRKRGWRIVQVVPEEPKEEEKA